MCSHDASLLLRTSAELGRSKSELMAENALLRQQLITLKRQVIRPACTRGDRLLLVLLAKMVRTRKQALIIVQPETLLRWNRQELWRYNLSFKRSILINLITSTGTNTTTTNTNTFQF